MIIKLPFMHSKCFALIAMLLGGFAKTASGFINVASLHAVANLTITGMTPPTNEMQEILDLHNLYRCLHSAPKLEWDETLTKNAQAWADKGYYEHSPLQSRIIDGTQVGENIAWGSSAQTTGIDSTKAWYCEIACTDPYGMAYGPEDSIHAGEVIGHYTQVVWRQSTKLGCGKGKANVNGKEGNYWVCQYSPAGNVLGNYLSNVHAPAVEVSSCPSEHFHSIASSCPANTNCPIPSILPPEPLRAAIASDNDDQTITTSTTTPVTSTIILTKTTSTTTSATTTNDLTKTTSTTTSATTTNDLTKTTSTTTSATTTNDLTKTTSTTTSATTTRAVTTSTTTSTPTSTATDTDNQALIRYWMEVNVDDKEQVKEVENLNAFRSAVANVIGGDPYDTTVQVKESSAPPGVPPSNVSPRFLQLSRVWQLPGQGVPHEITEVCNGDRVRLEFTSAVPGEAAGQAENNLLQAGRAGMEKEILAQVEYQGTYEGCLVVVDASFWTKKGGSNAGGRGQSRGLPHIHRPWALDPMVHVSEHQLPKLPHFAPAAGFFLFLLGAFLLCLGM